MANCFSQNNTASKQFLISSGIEDGNYNKTGAFLRDILDSLYTDYDFKNIVSSGSLENVKLLDERFCDFAISQRDVFLESLYDETNSIKNIELILPLFQENLLLYTNQDISNSTSFNEFSKKVTRIGVTGKSNYSYKIFEKICRLTNVSSSKFEVVEGNYNQLTEAIKNDEIDLIVSFSLPIALLEVEKSIQKAGFSKPEVTLITSKVTNVFPSPSTKDKVLYTFGSWTFLIGLNTSIESINEEYTVGISEKLIRSISQSKNKEADKILESIAFFKNQENHKILYGIPMTDSLASHVDYDAFNYIYLIFTSIPIVLLLIVLFVFRKEIAKVNYRIVWIRYKSIFIGIITIIGLYFLSVEVLLMSEEAFYDDLSIKSKILNLTKQDLHFWIIITNLTGNNNNIFPLSYLGQIMLPFSSYILIIGPLILAFWEYVNYKLIKKRIKGDMKYNVSDHIVVVGWKENTIEFLKELIDASKNYKYQEKKIICIADKPEDLIEQSKELRDLEASRKISFVAGDAREEETLKKACLHKANTVVILSEGSSSVHDEKTLLRSLAISRYCRKMNLERQGTQLNQSETKFELQEANKYEDSIYIIAEINNTKYTNDLKNSDVNEIVNSSEYSKNILMQSMLNHGVSKVLDEVLTYNSDNEFYTIDLTEKRFENLIDKTFDELIPILRTKGILLIAIRVVYQDTNGNEIIDEARLQKLLEKDHLTKQIIVNPTDEIEKNRPVDNDDQLIVFCTSAKVLENYK
ncbi:TrkA-related ion transporter [Kordia jejudonensis]|uniref:TrkA-related ion transporter n=1 Tax=Kordia jejudonensis TaxID=1348245 RepID=UPI0012E01EFE|nr:TAXI family TRAP transporter solute-binding subunit [Kordia jejudonensis]